MVDPISILFVNLINLFLWIILAGLLSGLFSLFAYIAFSFFRHRKREDRSLDSVLLQVAVPRDNEIKIDAAEQMFASLYSVKKGGWKQRFDIQDVISFELVAKKEEIKFYVWCPRRLQDLIEKQIHGAYTDAEITPVPEYNIFSSEGKVAYASLQLRSPAFNPIKIFKDLPTDPLSSLTSALAKMGEGEGVSIQILISPADSEWKKLGKSFLSRTKKAEADPEKASFKVDAKTMEAINNKLGKPGFETTIRIVVSSTSQELAKAHLGNLKSAFEQFSGDLNGFKGRKIRDKGSFVTDFLYRYHPVFHLWGNQKMILNSEELATVFHFPNKQVTTPHIHWLNAKRAPAPSQIPTSGLFIGTSSYRGVKRPVYIGEDDRRRHMYIIGKTGTGKTELLKDLIMQDIRAGKGICFMDPHGDAVQDILKMIPPERAEDVIYFNPADTGRPMGLNLLEAKTEDQKHFVATSVINMMYKLYDPYKTGIIGPRFEHAVRNAILTAFAQEGATFVEVVRILTDPSFVQELLPKVEDPVVRRYWTDQIAQTVEFHKSEVLDYIVSKFGRFVTNAMMRDIIGQSQSAFNLRNVMDEGKILLVNLAKGELGEENSNFLGLILVPRLLMSAMSRTDVPEEKRRDFYLYVDEFQNFATPDFAQILSEARKYRLNLCVANQFIGQVDEEIKNAVFGNVGTLVTFRVGVTDASYLAREFQPVFDEDDLLNIERFNVYMKTTVNNEPVPPFSVDLTKDISKVKAGMDERIAEIIREMSRLKYGRDRALVEAEITRRAKL
ncbi:MAG: type IV secretion system DNA-binding domain-containing protein [Candidatus Blackburnbacteria bacterium]|nr:type IV secretion system DNA-binding domain-containing protein [Candidatus Blackburnbacteria bacterium]